MDFFAVDLMAQVVPIFDSFAIIYIVSNTNARQHAYTSTGVTSSLNKFCCI